LLQHYPSKKQIREIFGITNENKIIFTKKGISVNLWQFLPEENLGYHT
jgi:hypothetical protein